jgi:hypothetical protein
MQKLGLTAEILVKLPAAYADWEKTPAMHSDKRHKTLALQNLLLTHAGDLIKVAERDFNREN